MKNINLVAKAKLNLNLHLIPEKTELDYFPVKFINTELSLSDYIEITVNNSYSIDVVLFDEKGKKIDGNINLDKELGYRAAKLILESYGIKKGLSIKIVKKIPIKAGLGGGSCDAAAVINGLDKLFNLNMTSDKKISYAKKLGMDVCYCVIGGLCLIEGTGEIIKPLPYGMPEVNNVLLVVPNIYKPSTAWAYSIVQSDTIGKNLNKMDVLIEGIVKKDIDTLCKGIWNDFEASISVEYPVVMDVINLMKRSGASCSTIAGSGLTVFGIFKRGEDLKNTKEYFVKRGFRCIETTIG